MRPRLEFLQDKPHQIAWAVFAATLWFGLLVRLRMFGAFAFAANPSPFYSYSRQGTLAFFRGLWSDLIFASFVAAAAWLALWGLRSLREGAPQKALHASFWIGLHLFLLLVTLAYNSHIRVLFEMQSGLTYDLVMEARTALTLKAFFTLLKPLDALFLVLPWLLLWLALWLPTAAHRWRDRSAVGLAALIALLELSHGPFTRPLHPAVSMHPMAYLVEDFAKTQGAGSQAMAAPPPPPPNPAGPPTPPPQPPTALPQNPTAPRPATPKPPTPRPKAPSPYPTPASQLHSLRLFEPLFAKPAIPPKDLLPKTQKQPWNIVFLVLESLGTQYMFNTSRGNRVPMAFMKKLLPKGWYYDYHFSTANSSPRSLFSIFTGLYPIPQFPMFVMRKDVFIPTLHNFLPSSYESFLVTASGLFWYFPKQFFLNNGPKDLVGARSKPLRYYKKYGSFPNEIDVVSYFIKRIEKAKEPFFATYVTFIPHGPYDDYGPKWRILPNVKKNYHRYINCLYVLDKQLERIYTSLERSGKLERTILVMVGDHGQAFWQHRYNYGHSRKSFNENYHAPLFFYQPKLFPARHWKRMTSHVDILPTLLDAMKIPYNPNLLQGESLYRSKFRRKQIFLFGNEQTLTSMRYDGQKMQYSLKRRRCWMYNLKTDPKERKRLSCKGHDAQWKALGRFTRLQKKLIPDYNRSRKRREPHFYQQKHPTVGPASR